MKRLLILVLFSFVFNFTKAQDSTFIFLTNTSELYSVKVGNTCNTPSNLKGKNNLATVWKTVLNKYSATPFSIAINNGILYVSDDNNNLYKGGFDSINGLTDKGAYVGKFPSSGPSYGLTVDSKGVVYSAEGDNIDTYNPKTGVFKNIGTNKGWNVRGDLIFWGGKLYEASYDANSNYALFQVDTSKKPATFIKYIDFLTPIFGIASVKQPCDFNQPYAMAQNGDIYPLDLKNPDPLKRVGAKVCNVLNYSGVNGSSVFDAASNAEGGVDQRPPSPANPVTPNDICKGAPFDFSNKVAINNPNDTLRWYVYPNMAPTIPKGEPFVNSNIITSYHYIVTEYDKTTKCESDTVSIILNVHPYPNKPKITPLIDTVCSASKLVSDTLSNQWYFNKGLISGANAVNYSATATGSYFDIVTNKWGCATVSDTARIKVLGVTFSYPGSPYCNSGLATVTKSGDSVGGKFSAAPIGIVIDSLTGTIDLGKSTPGTYTVTYTLNCSLTNCTYTTPVTIQNSSATIKYASDSFCQIQPVQNVTLSGTGTITGGVYTSTPVGLTLNSSTGDITPSSSLFGTYQIVYTYTDPVCGTFHDTTNVSIVDKITPHITVTASADTICTGTSVTFTATPINGGIAPTYQWYKNGILISGSTSNTYIDAVLNNGDVIFCALVSNAPCLASTNATSNTIKIVVNTFSPTILIAGTSTFCIGTSVTFSATATNAGKTPIYQWQVNSSNVGSNSSTFTSSTLNNNDTITCILSGVPTCSTTLIDTSNKLVMVVNIPTVSNTIAKICAGDKYSFNGTNYSTAGVYTIHLTNSKGCDSTATLNLTVNQPSASTTPVSICMGTSYTFNGSNYSTAGSFIIHLTNSLGCDSAATLVLTIKPTSSSSIKAVICDKGSYVFNGVTYTAAGTYVAHLTNSIGCDSAATLILTVNQPTTSTTTAEICMGKSYIFNGTTYTTQGTYTAHLLNAVGCDSAATLVLTVSNKLSVDPIVGSNTVNIGQTINLTNLTPNGAWISLYPSMATINATGIVTGIAKGVDTIFYVVSNVCGLDTADFRLTVLPNALFIPNTFSPNGNSLSPNATFLVRGDGNVIKQMELRVFDSWGNEIFMSKGEVNDRTKGWDGTYKGKAQPPGVYVYVARIEMKTGEIEIKKGAINLIR